MVERKKWIRPLLVAGGTFLFIHGMSEGAQIGQEIAETEIEANARFPNGSQKAVDKANAQAELTMDDLAYDHLGYVIDQRLKRLSYIENHEPSGLKKSITLGEIVAPPLLGIVRIFTRKKVRKSL